MHTISDHADGVDPNNAASCGVFSSAEGAAAGVTWPLRVTPTVRLAGRFPMRARNAQRTYDSPTLALHLHGYRGVIELAGARRPLAPGTITVTPPGTLSRYDLPRPGMHWCIHIELPKAASDAPSPRSEQPTVTLPLLGRDGLDSPAARRFAHITSLQRRARVARPGSDRRAAAGHAAGVATQELLLWLSLRDADAAAGDAPHPAVSVALAYIDSHLGEPMSVPQIADHAGLSHHVLARHFKRATGTTMASHLLHRRVDTARLLLSTTDLPIKAVAAEVGLPDASHFNKQFRSLVGVSPTGYRGRTRRP